MCLIIIYFFDRVTDSYGITEVGGISWNGMVLAEGLFGFNWKFQIIKLKTIDFMIGCEVKLVDVPEFGYTSEDKPYPRFDF